MGDSVWRIENGTLCNSLDLICLSIWNFNGKFLQDRDEYYVKGGGEKKHVLLQPPSQPQPRPSCQGPGPGERKQ